MKIKTFIFFLTLYNFCDAQAPDLTNWKIDTLPTGDRIYPANNSQDNWIFSKSGENWVIVRNNFKQLKNKQKIAIIKNIIFLEYVSLSISKFLKII